MASESRSGDAVVYTSSLLNSLLLLGIGGTICGFGAAFFYLGVKRETGRNRNPASHKVLAAGGGLVAMLGGAAILIIGVPYSFIAHITVYPDRVVMRDSVLWFANGDREIPYASVAEFSREDKVISRKRRKKEDLVIRFTGGSTERIEMGPRERAAYDKLVQAHQQYRVDHGGASASSALASDDSGSPAAPAAPPASSEVIRYYAYCGIPDGHKISREIELRPGDKGKICYEKQWQDITVTSRSEDREVEITWDAFDGRRTMVSTIDVFVPEAIYEARLPPALKSVLAKQKQDAEKKQADAERKDAIKARMAEMQAQSQAIIDAQKRQASPSPSPGPSSVAGTGASPPTGPSPPPPSGVPPRTSRSPGAGLPPSIGSTRKLKRYPIDIPLPQGAVGVTARTPLVPGVKLGACYWDKWEAVTVLQVHEDGSVKCKWDNWGSVYDMSRDDLIIAEAVLEEVRKQQAFVEPIEREWSDPTGKFKIMATYVDSKQGYVKLRKTNGEEISVPISKLSRTDRRVIAKLSKAAP